MNTARRRGPSRPYKSSRPYAERSSGFSFVCLPAARLFTIRLSRPISDDNGRRRWARPENGTRVSVDVPSTFSQSRIFRSYLNRGRDHTHTQMKPKPINRKITICQFRGTTREFEEYEISMARIVLVTTACISGGR